MRWGVGEVGEVKTFEQMSYLALAVAVALTACAPAATPTPVPTEAPTATDVAPVEPTALPTAEPVPTIDTVAAEPDANLTDGCVDEYSPDVDYFPEKMTVAESSGFQIEYFNHYKLITVPTPVPGGTSEQYVLVQCGTPAPTEYADAVVVEIPVERVVSMSTTYLPHLEQLGVLERVVGIDDVTYVSNAEINRRFTAGEIRAIGSGTGLNIEQTLDLDPDVIFTYGSGSADFDSAPILRDAGLPTVLIAEWLDNTPLGRAEWGKFLAAFFNKDGQAEQDFAALTTRYRDLQALTADLAPEARRSVLVGTPYEGVWYMPGGGSFAAAGLLDAGASYAWANTTEVASLPLTFEAVVERAQDAQVWLNIGFVSDRAALLAQDSRFESFAAYQSGELWNNDARTNPNGGNDYYESAVAQPDVVLADLIHILYPDLLPDHELVYYRQLE